MPLNSEVTANAQNLLRAMRFFGRSRNTAEIHDVPGVTLISCGLNYAAFNAALLSEPVGPDPNSFRERIQIAGDHFRSRKVRWTCWFCDDYLHPGLRRRFSNETRNLFSEFGMSPLTEPAGMFADRLHPPRRPLPELEIRRVDSEATRRAYAHITSVAFEIPLTVCLDVYGSAEAWAGDFHGLVGYANQLPVTTTATVVAANVVGIYSVGTLPQYRQRGYAEAMMRQVLAAEKERTGIATSILQATQSGLHLYQQMGYRKITKFSVYISD
ncbi:MAG: GNAT family N-acetyltransferase [Acidobacteriota bacterium]|nr:GNAT family N-acetyltransferase [Acidobacteriota bacterium]